MSQQIQDQPDGCSVRSSPEKVLKKLDSIDDDITEAGDDEEEEEELDPRVQEELEKLNKCTDEINKLELQLEDANCLFRTLLTDSTHQLKTMAQKVGSGHIEKARPYFEAMEVMILFKNLLIHECSLTMSMSSGCHQSSKGMPGRGHSLPEGIWSPCCCQGNNHIGRREVPIQFQFVGV